MHVTEAETPARPRTVDREDVSGLWAAAYVMRKVGKFKDRAD
jgi:hypothetical protein